MVIENVKKTIHGRYRIKKKGGSLILDKDIKVRSKSSELFGFSLDSTEHPPFSFLRSSPPRHIAKMCDAIVLLEHEARLYLTIIEQKTGDEADYERQLANGKFFCEWLMALFREHGYLGNSTISYYGVLIWEPRTVPLKGTTVHQTPVPSAHRLFDKLFNIQNESEIDVESLVLSAIPS